MARSRWAVGAVAVHSVLFLLLLSASTGGAAGRPGMPIQAGSPLAAPGSTVTHGNARFTLLYSGLVRLEYNTAGGSSGWVDSATMAIVNRQLPVPNHTLKTLNATAIQIATDALIVTYDDGPAASGFDSSNLRIEMLRLPPGQGTLWVPGQQQHGNLNGTYHSLDCYGSENGTSPVNNCMDTIYPGGEAQQVQGWSNRMMGGLLARDGWNLYVDDAANGALLMPEMGQPGKRSWYDLPPATSKADWYFHAYGSDFRLALKQMASLAGPPGLPPRWALGVWWSREWKYSAETIKSEVIDGFGEHEIPLNVLVLDMDWHDEPKDKQCDAYGNYDWNRQLFPDPDAFSRWLQSPNNSVGYPLRLSLNINPDQGIHHCEHRYEEFGKLLNFDTSKNASIPCNIFNESWTEALFHVYLNADPLQNVDVWWTDWNGCSGWPGPQTPGIKPPNDPHVNMPLLWSNYVFATERTAARGLRPFTFSRFGGLFPEAGPGAGVGGLGSHRYPMGFSGDTFQHEFTLDVQIRTTHTAANILFGSWSHDIGAYHGDTKWTCNEFFPDHHGTCNETDAPGDSTPSNFTGSELLLRWVQFGALSPIMRTHCGGCERRPWMFPFHFEELRDAYRLRNALSPYIYTESRRAYDTAITLLHPVYYDAPTGHPEAYSFDHQYMFGEQILAAPISLIVGPTANCSSRAVWLPPGSWSRWDGSEVLHGPAVDTQDYTLREIPMYVRAGSLLALKPSNMANVQTTSPDLVWTLWPGGGSGSCAVYEDDGDSSEFMSAGYRGAVASAAYSRTADEITLTIQPIVGEYEGIPASRSHSLQLRGLTQPPKSATVNGVRVPPGTEVNGTRSCQTSPCWWVNAQYSLAVAMGSVVVDVGAYRLTEAITITLAL